MQHKCQSTFVLMTVFVSRGGQIQREGALVQDKHEIMSVCCVKCSPVVKQIFVDWFTNTQRKYEKPDLSLTFIHWHSAMTPPCRSRLWVGRTGGSPQAEMLFGCLMVHILCLHPSKELMMNMSKKKSAKIRKYLEFEGRFSSFYAVVVFSGSCTLETELKVF